MKKNAFTLIELLVAIAILVIIVGMLTPLITSITKSNKKTQDINQLDLNIGKSLDIFKSAVRSSKTIENDWVVTGSSIYLTDGLTAAKSSASSDTAILVNVPKEIGTDTYQDEKVIFYFDRGRNRLMLNSTTGSSFAGVTGDVELVNNVENAFFTYHNNIATIYMEIKLDKNGSNTSDNIKRIRDSAVTRINISF